MTDLVDQALTTFEEVFGGRPDCVVRAPGRVNLIGEHTDYNEGFVLPCAIDRWIVFAARRRDDRQAIVHSAAHDERRAYPVAAPPAREGTWADYGKGVVAELLKLGHALSGFEAALVGDVPIGAGLSSSAAVEMAVGTALLELNDIHMAGPELALLGQRAENQFVGVNCGIMDQFVSANAREGHALFLDCRDLAHEAVPLPEQTRIVICNSAVTRGLTDSAYNERRSACEDGVRRLADASGAPLRALRDVSLTALDEHRDALSPTGYRRCRHVVTEIERTRDAVRLLSNGDVEAFGRLMYASHDSLRDDYEVSGRELDLLVTIARGVPGVLGARMTGAGFGGCTVNLVRADAVDALREEVLREYPPEAGLTPEVYACSAVAGAESVL